MKALARLLWTLSALLFVAAFVAFLEACWAHGDNASRAHGDNASRFVGTGFVIAVGALILLAVGVAAEEAS